MDDLNFLGQLTKTDKTEKIALKYEGGRSFKKIGDKDMENHFHRGYSRMHIDTIVYCTGSHYSGDINSIGFVGKGVYKYPHGVIYEGEFKDGQFHGSGTLIYPQGQRLEGTWHKGKLVDKNYKNDESGDTEFIPEKFLKFPRRVRISETDDDNKVNRTEAELAEPEHKIPEGCYDTGDGYFLPEEYIIYSYDGNMKRVPTAAEKILIENKFRQHADVNVGYKPDLYEYWTSARHTEIETILEPSQHSSNNDLNPDNSTHNY